MAYRRLSFVAEFNHKYISAQARPHISSYFSCHTPTHTHTHTHTHAHTPPPRTTTTTTETTKKPNLFHSTFFFLNQQQQSISTNLFHGSNLLKANLLDFSGLEIRLDNFLVPVHGTGKNRAAFTGESEQP